jgi:hypothetical protein
MAASRQSLLEVFGRYASPTRASPAVEALRAAFNAPEFEMERRKMRAALQGLMPGAGSGDAPRSADDHAFSALLSSSTQAEGLIR